MKEYPDERLPLAKQILSILYMCVYVFYITVGRWKRISLKDAWYGDPQMHAIQASNAINIICIGKNWDKDFNSHIGETEHWLKSIMQAIKESRKARDV